MTAIHLNIFLRRSGEEVCRTIFLLPLKVCIYWFEVFRVSNLLNTFVAKECIFCYIWLGERHLPSGPSSFSISRIQTEVESWEE